MLGKTDASEDNLLTLFLNMAIKKVTKTRHPFNDVTEEQKASILVDYEDTILNVAVFIYNKQGAEGQTSHSENGVSRSYDGAGIPDCMLDDVVPVARCRNVGSAT